MTPIELEALLKELLLVGETEWVEFKVNNQDPHTIGMCVSALSNSARLHNRKRGYLVYGVDNSGTVVGTSISKRTLKKGNEEIENWLLVHLQPSIDLIISEITYEGKDVVIFQVDATTSYPVKFQDVGYIRIGTYNKKLKNYPEKEKQLWDKSHNVCFEESIAMDKVTGDDVLKLVDYPNYFDLVGLPLPSDKSAILNKLLEEKLILKREQLYSITNMGAILLAKDINKFENLYRKVIRVIQYKGTDKRSTIREQTVTKGYAVGFEGLIDYINSLLPRNEEIGKAFRKEVRMYPEIAIRELVANALIHQDFSQKGTGPMIEIYDDRIEITNPGLPLIDTLRFIDHSPKSRNEKLAFLMRMMNICEERGSGIDKVIFQTELFQLPAPDFIVGNDYLTVVLYAYRPLRRMDRKDKIRACYQHCALKYITRDFMTNQTLRTRFGVHEKNYATVSRIIGDTLDAKYIKPADPNNKARKYAKYEPIWA